MGGRRSRASRRAGSLPRTASSSIPRTAPRPSPFSCNAERGTCNARSSGIRLPCPRLCRSPCDDRVPHRRADGVSVRLRRVRSSEPGGAVDAAGARALGGAGRGVEVRGDGPPLLLVHGFPFDRTMWRHQLAALARWKRIAPDLRGAGVSSAAAVGDGASVTRYADDLVAILDALGVGAAAVCGLSLGGYVTFELLRRHADRVSAVLLVDTKHEPDAPAAKRERDELAALTERDGPDALVGRLEPKLLAPETQPEVVEQVRAMARRWSVPGLVGALRALRDRPDSTETLRQIRVPTLVLAGSEDRIAPAAGARAMAALIPNAQFHVVPAAGHLAPLEQPLATTRVIADFLETLR